jgi:hypothetical protein
MSKNGVKRRSTKKVVGSTDQDGGAQMLNMKRAIALQFSNAADFRRALEIVEEVENERSEVIYIMFPPRENTFILEKKYADYFSALTPDQQEIGSTSDKDLTEEDTVAIREGYFLPKTA